jgi:protein TonB
MPESALIEKKYYVKGFYVSSFLYALVFLCLSYTIGKSDIFLQRFTAKENFLDIMIVEKPQDLTQTRQADEISVIQSSTNAPASAKTQTDGVQDLFKTINAAKLADAGAKSSTPSRLNGNLSPQANASRLLDKLELKQQKTLTVTGANSGVYDPFIGKIQDTLYEKWQNTIFTISGAEAQAAIEIDNMGRFSYYIVKLSYNNDFNAKLQNFLEEMKNEVFPPYEGDGKFAMNIVFKDLGE